MTDSWTSYPKIHALGHPELAASSFAFTEDTVLEEKIDGSQFSFGIFDGDLRMRSRKVHLHEHPPGEKDMFHLACQQVAAIAGLLTPGWTYRGEYLRAPKHNSITYGRAPLRNIILFDVAVGLEDYLSYEGLEAEADRLGLECVPLMHRGPIESTDKLLSLIDNSASCLGGMVEGVVIKNRGAHFGRDGKPVYAKFVTDRFKEVHRREWRKSNPTQGDIIERLINSVHVESRWEKALYRLRDAGILESTPRDIGKLIPSVRADVEEEFAAEAKEVLWQHFKGNILRGAVGGLPDWYKTRLAKTALEGAETSDSTLKA